MKRSSISQHPLVDHGIPVALGTPLSPSFPLLEPQQLEQILSRRASAQLVQRLPSTGAGTKGAYEQRTRMKYTCGMTRRPGAVSSESAALPSSVQIEDLRNCAEVFVTRSAYE